MTTTELRKTTVSFGIVSELTVDGETVTLILEREQDNRVTVYRGGMVGGQQLRVVALLRSLIPELDPPTSLQNLVITRMAVDLRPETGALAFEAAIENVWSVALDSGPTLAIDELSLSVLSVRPPKQTSSTTLAPRDNAEALSQQRKLRFLGRSRLFGGELEVAVEHRFISITPPGGSTPSTASQLKFSAIANNISITEVIKAFGFSQEQVSRYGLESLVVSLAFELERSRYSLSPSQRHTRSRYTFRGEVVWDTGLELTPDGETLQIDALVQIEKNSSDEPKGNDADLVGKIAGTVSASIPFFDTLELSVIYTFAKTDRQTSGSSQALATRTNELIFQLRIGSLLLSAVFTSVPSPKAPNDPKQNRKLLRFSVSLVSGKNPTIGDLIAYVVSLYDPSIVDFELDPPWDEFAKQEIALDKFSIEVDLTEKRLTISYQATLDVLIAKISNVGLSYQFGTGTTQSTGGRSGRQGSNKKVAIALDLSIPGQPSQRVQWDPVNENPPDVPGSKAPIFDLHFLALGQRVAFAPEIVQNARTVKQFTDVMQQSLVPLPPIKRRENPLTAMLDTLPTAVSSDPTAPINFSGAPIRFSAESGWLIGARFVILGAIDLSIVFNDPFIYGLRIGLSGPVVKVFDGFEFEILYRRISDTVGVYRAELTLPEAMRQLQFGIVSVTLPTVAVEIYTNGDFGLDVGFPWGGDFSRSVAVEALIFIGVGGFYFNKLSAETAKSVPVVSDGAFNPVLEFGIGLKLGLGRTFTKGPLNAEISITLHGLLQGVIAWFNPTDTRREKELFFRVQGGVAIVGRIYGEVDFKVIQVEVEVIARVGVLFVVEVYKAIQVALVAEVSVRASVKVLFVRVHFKFSLEVRQEFTLGSDSTPPWTLAAGSGGAMAATIPVFSARPRSRAFEPRHVEVPTFSTSSGSRSRSFDTFEEGRCSSSSSSDFRGLSARRNNQLNINKFTTGASEIALEKEGRSLRWTQSDGRSLQLAAPQQVRPETLKDGKLRLDLYFQTAVTKSDSGIKGVGLLFIENSIPLGESSESDNDTDFDELVKALLKWVVYAYLSDTERSALAADNGGIRLDDQAISLPMLGAIYQLFTEMLQTAPADDFWQPLVGFLATNFIFDVSDRPFDSKEISGTVFPMFPQLAMALKQQEGDQQTTLQEIDFDGVRYSPAQISTIQNYFKVAKHDQATETKLRSENNGGGDLAIAELLFIDYFSLIIRSALQLCIDHLKTERDDPSSNASPQTLLPLLDTLNDGKPFESLAGMTSRFLLHGLRLPSFEGDDSAITDFTPVYAATGQQFAITVKQTESDEIEVSPNLIQLSKPEDLSWIRLIDAPIETSESEVLTPNFNYSFDAELIRSIVQFSAASEENLPSTSLSLLDFYRSTPQRHTIRQKIAYRSATAATTHQLHALPLDLVEHLSALSEMMPTLELSVQQSTAVGKELKVEDLAPTNYQWATKLTIEIRQVIHTQTREVVPSVYVIEQIDTENLKQLSVLVAALAADNVSNNSIRMARMLLLSENPDSSASGLVHYDNARTLLLRTNLSVASDHTDASADTSIAAIDNENSDSFGLFLTLLRESSFAGSDRYYLGYQYSEGDQKKGLESLFFNGETAKVTLLVLFDANTAPAPYHNSVQPLDHSIQGDIVAKSSETTSVLHIPAGNLGITLSRAESIENPDAATDELDNLYQLLHYAIPSDLADFKHRKENPPIGPVKEKKDPPPSNPEESIFKAGWLYEKVFPVYSFTDNQPNASALPERLNNTLNPYYGIGDTFELDVCWQDVYGNRFGESTNSRFSQKLGYFDPIIGINQWPSVGESYRIRPREGVAHQVELLLELAFDQAKYVPSPTNAFAEALDHIKTDRATYQQVYYQVHDGNMRFEAQTSIIPGWRSDFPRDVLSDFVDDVYTYLVTLEQLTPLEHFVNDGETLQSIADRYGVSLETLVEPNVGVRSLWQSEQILVPVDVRVEVDNSSLWSIAQRLVDRSAPPGNPPRSDDQKAIEKTHQIVQTHASTTGLLEITDVEQAEIAAVLNGYITQPEETFESIAIAQLAIAEDTLVNRELQSFASGLDPAQILATGTFIRGAAESNAHFYVTLNATLESLAYITLQLEFTHLNEDFDALLPERAREIATLNQLPETGLQATVVPETTVTFSVRGQAIAIKTISVASWEAIAAAFPNGSETVESIILANAARQDWLATRVTIDTHTTDTNVTQPHDSLLHLALAKKLETISPSENVLKADIVAEVGALDYVIESSPTTGRSLSELTYQLQLKTNRHRTVLETVRAVGNIAELIESDVLTAQLNAVADALSRVTVLFGTQDVILSDLLLDYTVQPEDSLENIVAVAAERTVQTSAEVIALQNPDLKLQPGRRLQIPARFELDAGLPVNDLAIYQGAESSLQAVATGMGRPVAAVAIANQTLSGLLNIGTSVDSLPILQKLLSISQTDFDRVGGVLADTFPQSYRLKIAETFYTLADQLVKGALTQFNDQIEAKANDVVQAIGQLNAIGEQLSFPDANVGTLSTLLTSALTELRSRLLEPSGQLKAPFVAATVHSDVELLSVTEALAVVESAISTGTENLAGSLQNALKILNRLYEVSALKFVVDMLEQRRRSPVSVAEVGNAIASISNLINPNQLWIVPPAMAETTLSIDAPTQAYPSDLIFPVSVQLEMRRLEAFIYRDEQGNKPELSEVEAITGYFSPKTVALTATAEPSPSVTDNAAVSDEVSQLSASLTPFAKDFERAFSGLKLAVGKRQNARSASQGTDSLYAVHMGNTGVRYNIQSETPLFFATVPLATTLMSANVDTYTYAAETGLNTTTGESIRVESVDLNALARKYLQAIEEILKPEIAIHVASEADPKEILNRILKAKKRLADIISQTVTHVLEPESEATPAEYAHRQQQAATTLRQALLANLAKGYDIETIVQYAVEVAIATGRNWPATIPAGPAPRLSGQPTITSAYYGAAPNSTPEEKHQLLQSLDFSLSPAKVSLAERTQDRPTTLTFLFDTKTPQRYEDIVVDLTYQANELEYNINPQDLASSWLSFVIPFAQPASTPAESTNVQSSHQSNHIGEVQIPIPLRNYPIPPSLIAHQALPDPDGFAGDILSADDIRDWNYVFLYEHPDIAQDTVECRIDYNSASDQVSRLNINNVSVPESAGTADFVVTLFPPADGDVTVDFATQDGTAKSTAVGDTPPDYTAINGTLTFAPGDTTKTISVPILNDDIVEETEAFTVVLSNATGGAILESAVGTGTILDSPLLDALIRFDRLYPTLLSALDTQLAPLTANAGITDDNRDDVIAALAAFATLTDEVVNAWQGWQPLALAQSARANIHYTIDEEQLGASADKIADKVVTVRPTRNLPESAQQILTMELPGYVLKTTDAVRENGNITSLTDLTTPYESLAYSFEPLADATGVETFGESDLPDRRVKIIDLDVLKIQNAWGAIRLARNFDLVEGRTTNPAFIFQTPEVRFKNRVTPLIINDKRWNIAALSPSPQSLENHLRKLFETVLPRVSEHAYDLRLSCQYAFALAVGSPGIADDLLTALPVLLTPRFTVQPSAAQPNMLAITEQLRRNIVTEINDWQQQKRPNPTKGRYVFSMSLFSQAHPAQSGPDGPATNPNLPLLQIDHLELALADIV